MKTNHIYLGDCREILKTFPDNSIDSIITDPPYHLVSIVKRFGKSNSAPAKEGKDGSFKRLSGGFMGKTWDGVDENGIGIAYDVEMWKECLRVLKPGGYLLSFGGCRTYHRMACAIEDAGFEIKNMLEWIFASGFPKSQNIGKMYDKKMGNKRISYGIDKTLARKDGRKGNSLGKQQGQTGEITKGTSPYEGLGTALKPAHEPILCARKPLSEKTVVDNVMKWGTGGIEIDECRIPTKTAVQPRYLSKPRRNDNHIYGVSNVEINPPSPLGRFPANVLCQDDALNDGEITKGSTGKPNKKKSRTNLYGWVKGGIYSSGLHHADSGSKSRYFDIDVWNEKYGLLQFPKASRSERNKGCDELESRQVTGGGGLTANIKEDGSFETASAGGKYGSIKAKQSNTHPTVKSLALMRYLVTLVSREGQTVLDPFAGSGTTLVACKELGRNYIGIEMEEEYIKIAKARINACQKPMI